MSLAGDRGLIGINTTTPPAEEIAVAATHAMTQTKGTGQYADVNGINLGSIALATLGAILLLVIYRMTRHRTVTR